MDNVNRAGRAFRRWLWRILLLVIGPLAIAIAGFVFYMQSGRYVETENAYVKAELIIVTAEVSGRVVEVAVKDNQPVELGQLLFRIDPTRFQVAQNQHTAALAAARRAVEALKARLRAKQAELRAAVREADYVHAELQRVEKLRQNGNVAEARLLEVRRDHLLAQNAIRLAQENIAEVLAELGGDADMHIEEHPNVMRAEAALQATILDLQATTVKAPRNAVTAQLSLQAGEYVTEGDPVLVLVSVQDYWVEANLKETALTHLRQGQQASLRIDAYPDHQWQAEVDSIAPATGSEYALLPAQNASGNWVKVVQRLPVRLKVLPNPDAPPLRAGMSVTARIDTGYERPWPEILTPARAWILPARQ